MASTSAPKKTYEIVQQGIKELHNPANADVDIIAIPGLGAPPLESWKSVDPQNEFNWLTATDGLAKEFPKARILLYMYQSAWSGPLKVRQFMSSLATTLLYALNEKRKDNPRRPIVFLGHSMGGLIIAKAVAIAESRREHFGKMFEAITGCVFFGTPFDGTHAAAAASMFAQVSEFLTLDQATGSKLLDLMKPGDEGLRDLKNEFMRLCTKMSPKIELFCFYEEKPTDWSRQAGLPFKIPLPKKYEDFVTRESATLTGVDNLGLAKNHRELVKFDSFKDTVYQIVRGPLKNIINSAPLIAKNRFNSTRGIDRDVVKKVLGILEGVQIEKRRRQLAQGVIRSSWILQEEEYKQWLNRGGPHTDCLWVLGPEGKGKLGASLAAIDHVEDFIRREESLNSGQAANLFAYFLCDSTVEGSSPEELLKSLLRQLVNQQEVLAAYAKQFVNSPKAGLTVENLWQSLQDMLTDDLVGTVYFVINNLHSMDEDGDSTKKLMEFIRTDISTFDRSPRARVRWLFTSQQRHTIKTALSHPGIHLIDLDDDKYGNQVQQELRLHAQQKIAALGMKKGYNKALTYFAGSLIGRRAQNTQWIDITIIQLAELPTDARDLKVRSMLERVPQDLKSLLDRAWLSVLDPKDDKLEEIKEMLRTLIITYEEPTEDDLAVLTGLSHDAEARAHLCVLVEKCRPLLTFHKSVKGNETIGFMNSVVKSHLLDNAEKLLGLSPEDIRWQHGILALRNFSYLMDKFGEEETEEDETEPDITPEEPAVENAVSNEAQPENINMQENTWIDPQTQVAAETDPNNASVPEPEKVEGGEEQQFDYFDDDQYDTDEDIEHQEGHIEQVEESDISDYAVKHWLHHASKATADIAETLSQEKEFWKLDSVVREKWLETYNDLTGAFRGVRLKGLTGLHVASSIGFAQLVAALLKNGYEKEMNTLDTLWNAPLHLAAYLGRPNIAEVLLNSGAKVDDGKEAGHSTPLAMAASKGHCKVMVKLLNRGADPNALADGSPVINDAIVSGNLEAVRLLVEHGAVLTHDDESDNPPPLALSALLSDLTMFTYLLDACADKIPHIEYNKAFVYSAVAGRIEVTKRLLQFGHSTEVFQGALVAAAGEENWEILILILENSRGLDCDEVFHQIAISSEQQDRILSAIWRHTEGRISKETLDKSLYQAVDKEKETTVKLLLEEFHADANATGEEYGNALTAAAYDGTLDIIKMLIAHGADVNSPNGYALQIASEQGHYNVVEFLLQCGAYVNVCVDLNKFPWGTALQGACEAGQLDIVVLLIEHKADPDLGAGPQTCPIIAACRKGEPEILDQLIIAGATVNLFGGPDLSTPLINAAGTMYKDSVESLLNAGANINTADQEGDTALIVAADVGDEELVAFLLERGADITHVSTRNVNALQTALKAGATECVRVLVEATTRVLTAFNSAIKQGNEEVRAVVHSVDYSGLIPPPPPEEVEPESVEKVEGVDDQGVKGDENAAVPYQADEHIAEQIGGMVGEHVMEPVENGVRLETGENMMGNQYIPEPENVATDPAMSAPTYFAEHLSPQEPSQRDPTPEPPANYTNANDVVPSPIRQNPAFPGYQDYQDFRTNQPVEPAPLNHSPPATRMSPITEYTPAPVTEYNPAPVTDYTPAPVNEYTPAPVTDYTPTPVTEYKPAPVNEYTPAPVTDYTPAPVTQTPAAPVSPVAQTSSPVQTYGYTPAQPSPSISQSPSVNQSVPPGAPITLADQLQAYQSYQSVQANQDAQSYPAYQGYQGYQRPSRKPLSSNSPIAGLSRTDSFQNGQNYPAYQGYQGYQSQTPTPGQAYQSPSDPAYHTPTASQDHQNQRPPQTYPSPPASQGYQSPQPVHNYQQPEQQQQQPPPQHSSPLSSFGNRISGYFQSNDQSSQSSKFKYNNGW
ncbi:Ankyrin-1 [Dactylellina cionopaga]|nr:Ankyrin-1 [Dactylellina cionopaga]